MSLQKYQGKIFLAELRKQTCWNDTQNVQKELVFLVYFNSEPKWYMLKPNFYSS